jgi:hypothetical protein
MKTFFISALICLLLWTNSQAFDEVYPDPALTPGATDPDATKESLCGQDFKEVNFAPNNLRSEVFARYGVDQRHYPCPCELDHFIPLELGGSETLENLWPQPYHAEDYNARMKDYVERRLHKEVCEDDITLQRAQEIIRTDWVKCYTTYNEGELCK